MIIEFAGKVHYPACVAVAFRYSRVMNGGAPFVQSPMIVSHPQTLVRAAGGRVLPIDIQAQPRHLGIRRDLLTDGLVSLVKDAVLPPRRPHIHVVQPPDLGVLPGTPRGTDVEHRAVHYHVFGCWHPRSVPRKKGCRPASSGHRWLSRRGIREGHHALTLRADTSYRDRECTSSEKS